MLSSVEEENTTTVIGKRTPSKKSSSTPRKRKQKKSSNDDSDNDNYERDDLNEDIFGGDSSEDSDLDSNSKNLAGLTRSSAKDGDYDDDSSENDGAESSEDEWGADLMGDDKDRNYLMSLTEMERESIIYERSQVRQRRLEKKELRRRLRQKDVSSKRSKQMKILLDAKDKKRNKKKAIEEGAIEEDANASLDNLYKKMNNQSINFEDLNGQSEEIDANEIDLDSSACIYLTRELIEKYLFRSFFPDMVKGMFVRVFIGHRDGSPVYRIALVDELVDYHKAYKFGNLMTDKALKICYVKSSRTFRFDVFSNSPIQAKEFDRWKMEMKLSKIPLYRKSIEVEEIRGRCTRFLSLPISEEEINIRLSEKQRLSTLSNMKGKRNFADERIQLLTLMELAKSENCKEEVENIKASIRELDAEHQEYKKIMGHDDRLSALAVVNKRNRMQNIQGIREAELKVISQRRSSSSVAQHELDPFARRRCKPDSYVDFGSAKSIAENDELEADGDVSYVELPSEMPVEVNPDLNPDVSSSKALNALYKAHDFDLDIEI